MANFIPGVEFVPAIIAKGDFTEWLLEIPGFDPASPIPPATAYGLEVTIIFGTGVADFYTITGIVTGSQFLMQVSPDFIDDFAAGDYPYQARLVTTLPGPDLIKEIIGIGRVKLLPDFAVIGTDLFESQVKRTLDALKLTIEGKASKDQMAYTIAGRSLSRMTASELLQWLSYYQSLYNQELKDMDTLMGKSRGGLIKARFPDV